MAERQYGDKWSLGPAPGTSVAAAEADGVPPSSVSSQEEKPASSLPHASTRDEVSAPTPQTADLARENRFATIKGANSGDSTRENAEEWSDDEHGTQHFADNGVELDEAENDMATLALNPGMMQDEQIADPSPQMVTDARMAERLVEGGDADLMLRLKAGDLQCFDVLMNKYRRQSAQPGSSGRNGAGSVPAGVSGARNLPCRGKVYDLALSHCDEPRRQSRARHQE